MGAILAGIGAGLYFMIAHMIIKPARKANSPNEYAKKWMLFGGAGEPVNNSV